MARLKDVKLKIGSVKKTKQITKAMNMVATSRFRGAQNKMESFRPYALKFSEVLGNLAKRTGDDINLLLVPKAETKNINLVLFTSDRGLCGGFNTNLISKAESFIEQKKKQGINISVTCFGKKSRDWCKKNDISMSSEHIGIIGNSGFSIASTVGKKIIDNFLSNIYDEVYLLYSEFVSMAKQPPIIKQLLPILPIEFDKNESPIKDVRYLPDHICEPSPVSLLGELLPQNIYVQLFSALLETSTSENAARMAAMDNATKACNDMIGSLTLAYNKARQSAITAELMDIVGGAEALKG